MITASDYREQFTVNDEDEIQTHGIFYQEHISIPYFWESAMNGDAVDLVYNDGTLYFMTIGDSDLEVFPELKDRYGLCLYQHENGYIYSVWFDTRADFIEAQSNPDEMN